MRTIGVLALAGLLGMVVAFGCSGGDDKADGGGSTSTATDGGQGGTSTTTATASSVTSTTGLPITSAPAAWDPPADCGGIGNSCPNLSGCAERSACQAVGNVCIPAFDASEGLPSRTTETPYCAAYTCMTFEEASCFCTGEARVSTPDCASPSALAGLCVGQGRSCASSACCDGLNCVDTGSGSQVCELPCATATDCESGCCTDLRDTGDLICAELEACENPCKKEGEACEGSETVPSNCCQGSCVESEVPDFAGCRHLCDVNEDCDTGCCVPFSNTDSGFCADAFYCSCGAEGAACGSDELAPCCEGTVCAGTGDDGAFECDLLCTQDSDCASGCCTMTESGTQICAGPEFCP